METRGFSVDLVTISSLLIGFHKQGRWDWKEKLMKHIREGNLVPNVLRWNAGVEASLKRPQSKDKDYTPMFPSKGSFLDIMSMVGSEDDGASAEEVSPMEDDPWSSSPYMDQLAHQRNQPKPLFGLARGQRVEAKPDSFDVDMMNTFLSIYLSKGDLSLACKLFEIFNGMGVTDLTSYTYNSMMSSFVKKGYFQTARGVLDQMFENFCAADIATYNVIIQGLGKMGRADLASAVLDRLTKQGGYLDIVMYNTLINALGKATRLDEATQLFDHMKSNGINPDVVSYNTMIEVNSKAGKLKEAYKYLKAMLDAEKLEPKSKEPKENRKPKKHHPDNVYQKQSLSRNRQTNTITNITSSLFHNTNTMAQSICTTAPVSNAVFTANRIRPETLNRTRSRFSNSFTEFASVFFTVDLLRRGTVGITASNKKNSAHAYDFTVGFPRVNINSEKENSTLCRL
ncbi:hypothetical protein [Arabidopsis thaliana]|nr:hypothetical protein [Arabidopsis thaliana]